MNPLAGGFCRGDRVRCLIDKTDKGVAVGDQGTVVGPAKSSSSDRKSRVCVDFGPGKGKLNMLATSQVAAADKVSAGCKVTVNETFTPEGNSIPITLERAAEGEVVEIDSDGDAEIDFVGVGHVFVLAEHFSKISVRPADTEKTAAGPRLKRWRVVLVPFPID